MPLYTFVCPNSHRFDTMMFISEYKDTITCLKCGEAAKREWSTVRPTIKTDTGVGNP